MWHCSVLKQQGRRYESDTHINRTDNKKRMQANLSMAIDEAKIVRSIIG
jgi:hypothetical protein